MKRVALYLRVSTADQHPENQGIDLRQAAAQRGWTVVEEYTDYISGAQAKRPALDRLLNDARRGGCDVVMVAAFDRMARSVKHLLDVIDELSRAGVEFVSVREGVDTAGAMGRAISTIMGAIAELERSLIIERVKCGMRRAKLEGRHIGRKPLVVDAAQIHEDRTVLGYSLQKIAKLHSISKTTVGRILKAGPQGGSQPPSQAVETTTAKPAA